MTHRKPAKILLAKKQIMFYSISTTKLKKTGHICCFVLLILSVSLNFQSNVSASGQGISAEEYRLKGYEQQQAGHLTEALSFYIKATEVAPNVANAYNDAGIIYEQLGLTDQAQESYLKAIQINKGYLPAYLNLAYLYLHKQDTEKAIEYFEQRIALGDKNDFWTQKAQEELNRIKQSLPVPTAKSKPLVSKINHREADDTTKVNSSQNRIQAKKHYLKGVALYRKGQYVEALSEYDQALILSPRDSMILKAWKLAQLGVIRTEIQKSFAGVMNFLNSGDTIAAKKEIRKMLAIIPNDLDQSQK